MAADPAQTRQRLVEGAQRAIGQHGLRGLTVEQCIRASDLSRRTFYQYFRDRDAVIAAVYERVADDMVAAVEAAIARPAEPRERLYAGIDAYLDIQQHGGRLIGELQAEAANPTSPLWPQRERALDRIALSFGAYVTELLGVSPDPLVWRALFCGLEGLVLHARNGGPLAPDRRAEVERVARPFYFAVLASAQHFP